MRRIIAAFLLLLLAAGVAAANSPDDAPDESASSCIAGLIADSAGLSLPARVERAFLLTLHGAADALRQGEVAKAQTLLRTFSFEVRGVRRARRIPAQAADDLIDKAESLIVTMNALPPR